MIIQYPLVLGDIVEGLKRESEINRYSKGAICSKSVVGCEIMIMPMKTKLKFDGLLHYCTNMLTRLLSI